MICLTKISEVCVTGMWNLNNGLQLPILFNNNPFSPVSYNYTTDINNYVVKRNEKLNPKENYKQ
jgi:hypothetical protein